MIVKESFNSIRYLSNMDLFQSDDHIVRRKVKIICTLGPATETVEAITKLRKAGMNIARLNFSHGSHEYHLKLINAIRESEREWEGPPIAIALDTKGPEKRLGDLEQGEGYLIEIGDEVVLTTDPKYKNCGNPFTCGVFIDFSKIGESLHIGQAVYVDDGSLTLIVQSIEKVEEGFWKIRTKAKNSQKILGRKGVNTPECPMTLPPVSEKDYQDLQFAVKHKLDIILVSFTRDAADIQAVRKAFGSEGKDFIKVIAKLENREGIENFDEILQAADGILVERGDLGIEIPIEKIGLVQKMMIARSNLAGKPVICATQMLESMTMNPRPTRAEVTDVTNAVLDGADCLMLSGETAIGKYPTETVEMMHQIIIEAERVFPHRKTFEELYEMLSPDSKVIEMMAMKAAATSLEKSVKAIIVLSKKTFLAGWVAKYRPIVPILVITQDSVAARQLNLHWGCAMLLYPCELTEIEDFNALYQEQLDWAIKEGKKMEIFSRGDSVIILPSDSECFFRITVVS